MRWIGIVAVAFFLAGGWYFFSGEHAGEFPTKGANIVAFGDSLTEGVGATPGNDYVSVLSRSLGVPIINVGRAGDTTASALSRLDQDVLENDPKVVILLLGGNDMLARIPKETAFQNLKIIVKKIKERGSAVILVGINGGIFGRGYGGEYERLAREENLWFVPNVLNDILSDDESMYDRVHPNDTGHAIMAERIQPILEELVRANYGVE